MNIKLITVVSFLTISTMISCAPQEPIRMDKKDEDIYRVIPMPVARELVAKHTGYEWVDNPFLNTTVEKKVTEIALPPKPDKIIEKYKGKKPVALIDLVVYPHPTRKKCIVLGLRGGHPFDRAEIIEIDENTYEFIDIHPKIICARSLEERKEIIIALEVLGAEIRRRI